MHKDLAYYMDLAQQTPQTAGSAPKHEVWTASEHPAPESSAGTWSEPESTSKLSVRHRMMDGDLSCYLNLAQQKLPSEAPVAGQEADVMQSPSRPRIGIVDLRLHSRAMPESPLHAWGPECGPACRWPPRACPPELTQYAADLRGMGPAEALPPVLIPWSEAGWELRLGVDGDIQMLPAPGCRPVRGDDLRCRLDTTHERRRVEIVLEAWIDLQARLDVADACMDEVPRTGPAGIAFPAVPRRILSSPAACAEVARTRAGWVLAFVPESLKTEALCLDAVRKYGRALAFVPERLRTPEMCSVAVRQDGMALEFVPEDLRTEDLCRTAVDADGRALKFVLENRKTAEICAVAVRQNGWAVADVPEAVLTPELCLAAVRQAPLALRRVPATLQAPALCLEAVTRNGLALVAVPDAAKTEALCLEAVQRAGLALQWVPDGLKSKEICLVAVRQNARAMEDVLGSLKTKEFCLDAVRANVAALDFVPDAVRTTEFCLEAVRQVPLAISCWRCPKTPAICMAAVRRDGRLLRWIPESLRTPELCAEAVRQNAVAAVDVPARRATPRVVAGVARAGGRSDDLQLLQAVGLH